MAVTVKLMSLIVATLGMLSFIFGVIAENTKVTSVSHVLFLINCFQRPFSFYNVMKKVVHLRACFALMFFHATCYVFSLSAGRFS